MRLFLVDACIRAASADKAEAILSYDIMQDRRLAGDSRREVSYPLGNFGP